MNTEGNGCEWYIDNFSEVENPCGTFDDEDFVAADFCCVCGGGQTETIEPEE